GLRAAAHDQQIAAADRALGQPGGRLANELAVHDRYAPIVLASEALGNLPAVAEEAQCIAELERLLARKSRIAGGAGRSDHALPDPVLQLLLQLAGGDREQQHTHAGPAIRRPSRAQLRVNPGLAPAAD